MRRELHSQCTSRRVSGEQRADRVNLNRTQARKVAIPSSGRQRARSARTLLSVLIPARAASLELRRCTAALGLRAASYPRRSHTVASSLVGGPCCGSGRCSSGDRDGRNRPEGGRCLTSKAVLRVLELLAQTRGFGLDSIGLSAAAKRCLGGVRINRQGHPRASGHGRWLQTAQKARGARQTNDLASSRERLSYSLLSRCPGFEPSLKPYFLILVSTGPATVGLRTRVH